MSKADESGWLKAIERVEASAKQYHDYAVEVGETGFAGAMYNNYKYDIHRCAILGRMLGHTVAVKSIEEFEYPPLGAESDPHSLLVFSISLDSWVAAAKWSMKAEEYEKINTWNLDCVGKYSIPKTLFMESNTPNADFKRDGDQLFVYGDIDPGFYNRFVASLDENAGVKEVVLGSGGGSVIDAIRSGYEIRLRGLNTTIFGNCYSACPLVFMGGLERVLWASPSRLGFHQMYRGNGLPAPVNDPMYKIMEKYLLNMGIDPVTVIGWMLSAEPSEMFEPKPEQLCGPGVTTFVQRICDKTGTF